MSTTQGSTPHDGDARTGHPRPGIDHARVGGSPGHGASAGGSPPRRDVMHAAATASAPLLTGMTAHAPAPTAVPPAFFNDFHDTGVDRGKCCASGQVVQGSWNVAYGASAIGTLACVPAWGTDFRQQLTRVDVPTLIVRGDQDRTLPIASTAIPLSRAVKGSRRLAVFEGGPHAIIYAIIPTHADQVNAELLKFLA